MYRLRIKIALIFVVSIFAVVLVATLATSVVLNSSDLNRLIGPLARNMVLASDVVAPPPADPTRRRRGEIVATLPEGTMLPDLTAALQTALRREERDNLVQVLENTSGEPVAGMQLPDGRWMMFPFPRPLPISSQLWLALAAWLGLVVAGVTGVALVMAHRVTRPFAILEAAVASVGPDGVLPVTPEVGTGEARQTARALNRLRDRLRTAMDSRMRLVAAAGHDLRTPMTRMRLRAEFLSEEERAGWLADLDELDAIADSAIRLVREEGAGEDSGPVALDSLVKETVSELSGARLPVVLTEVEPATVTAGPLALKRALRNLVTNAATHGGGARVALSVHGDNAELAIDDDGPGIPEALIPQVFEPFFRANPARTQTTKGAGLGLAIAREIIERFGGTIEIANRPEGGLRQVVRLRLA